MAKYFIQGNAMSIMADKARKLANTEDNINGAEILEIMSRTQGTVKTDGERLIEVVNYDDTSIKSGMYDPGEVFAMPAIPSGNDLLEFDSWSATTPITNDYIVVNDNDVRVGAVMKPVNDCITILVETTEVNTTITIHVNMTNGGSISWGDGTSDAITDIVYNHSHMYINPGFYMITIPQFGCVNQPITNPIETDGFAKHIYIPSWVKNIYMAFKNMKSLCTVVLADGVTIANHGSDVFTNCSSLELVVLPHSITRLVEDMFGCNNNNNLGVKSVVLPYGITEISNDCFSGNQSIKRLVIPNSVTSIGDHAFSGTSLDALVLPNSVISIGSGAFSGTSLDTLVLPNSVISIGDYAFYHASLDTLVLPNSVTSIGDYAFSCNRSKCITNLIILSESVLSVNNTTFKDYADNNNTIYVKNIYVQDNLVNAYKVDSNWSAYSNVSTVLKPLSAYTAGGN